MNLYLLLKSLHLISVVSWMAGLLYLPRIFVYHAENNSEVKTSEIFKIMEKKLYFYIMTPAMILSWFFGLILIHEIGCVKNYLPSPTPLPPSSSIRNSGLQKLLSNFFRSYGSNIFPICDLV